MSVSKLPWYLRILSAVTGAICKVIGLGNVS